ncbi:sensor histidine kinase [Sinimarinibacterium sp. CAU 1509]|uniref:sensor histidine kinase n=1 Tax=Sinimarinibacterium sp. CAU 1509 TaxID=2562283 RepID=UPI0010AC0EA8|nr:sensor histidine kinase [Sinimarinibacterium sp. CAU 1509]TJY59537.1 sensor histidine kinase [Sinimarinibacterium sp. CAU 1509]
MLTYDMRTHTPEALEDCSPESTAAVLESERLLTHLKRAEREILWIRVIGMLSWLVVLYLQGYGADRNLAWAIFVCGVLYTTWSYWSAQRGSNIQRTSAITTLGDPLAAFAICYATGGINSIFFVFFYFTLLATAFRFGPSKLIGIALVNGLLAVLLYLYAPDSNAELKALLIALYYLGVITAMAAMLANWARQNIALVQQQSHSLFQASQRLRWLLHRLINAGEEEKKNIAHDLHDRMSGRMFNLRQISERLRSDVGQQQKVQSHLDMLAKEISECTHDVRNIMNELQPTVLEELGFYEAAVEYLMKLSDVVSFELNVHIDPSLRGWRSRYDAALFRILQEAMLNLRKHANPKQVEVRFVPDGSDVLLTIADDGPGFDAGNVPLGHYGLMAMRERAEALGGCLKILSQGDGSGTKIVVRLPGHTPDE